MSELKAYKGDVTIPVYGTIADAQVYLKSEADKVIAELETENESLLQQNRELCLALQVMYSKEEYDKLKAEHHKERHEYIKMIAELKQKLEDAKATAYTESVDAGMENRRLKRALWLARSYRGRDNSILLPSKFMRNVWDNVERKCLKKAEQYK